jgi:hypothetical protein
MAKKSVCYRALKSKDKGIFFEETPSYMEVVTDNEGNEFNIHIHKVGYKWSATEESTGLRCVRGTYRTRKECEEEIQAVKHLYYKTTRLGEAPTYAQKLKKYKESLKNGNI